MSDRISVSIEHRVADVRLSRPDKLNALDLDMFEALVRTGETLSADRSLRAVVLSGEGRAFCAGLDMSLFRGGVDGASRMFERSGDSPANLAQRAAWIWNEVPVPVIAALHGVVYGGGLQIALAADIRFVAPDARLSVMEVKWGLIPDMSGTQTLRRLVRLDIAKELTYTGRVVSGAEAVELGLATHVSDAPRDAAFELAREIARRSPSALRAGKRLLHESGLVGTEAGLQLEEKFQRSLMGGRNQIEAVRINVERREPDFSDPE